MTRQNTTRWTSLLLALTLAVPALGAAACNKFAVTTPEHFVSLKRWRSTTGYKAVSPDNAVIAIRSFKHRDKGDLAYWAEILRREMTLRKGYTLVKTEKVKTDRGHPGQRLVFRARSGKSHYTYAVALFVTGSWIHVVQTAAKDKTYTAYQGAFDDVIASFRPR